MLIFLLSYRALILHSSNITPTGHIKSLGERKWKESTSGRIKG